MLQLYVLKLLKLQSRYFGRQWRKNNMSIMSAIYQKVRHRLTDDWAYGNGKLFTMFVFYLYNNVNYGLPIKNLSFTYKVIYNPNDYL